MKRKLKVDHYRGASNEAAISFLFNNLFRTVMNNIVVLFRIDNQYKNKKDQFVNLLWFYELMDCGVSIDKLLRDIESEKFEGCICNTVAIELVNKKICYIFSAFDIDLFDKDDDFIFTNNLQLSKDNFIDLMKRWQQDVLVNKPEFVLLWQDEKYQVYLECFEDEVSVQKRVDEVKRVVGEEGTGY